MNEKECYTSRFMAKNEWSVLSKWQNVWLRALKENRYLLDERLGVKMDSGMDESSAMQQTLDEYFSEIQFLHFRPAKKDLVYWGDLFLMNTD